MMKPGAADASDVHARPLADRLEAFEDGYIFGGIGRHGSGFRGSPFTVRFLVRGSAFADWSAFADPSPFRR
jgi:hypothetical protein